ncbi:MULTISPECIES: hypothetical protein [Nocardia]|nr:MULTISPECIES: hypothetical protein [Nocardia]MBF6187367.1 hypothetical protein [Nocardia farcinica]MBF6313016.1 hypothetical protein [Nocardia farcinica]MBF6408128.1 hypothetical protein [Nocardia farcinica]UEX23242.1 hypothetical protein LMJ57_01610 [Nocardia farcinica]
MTVAVVIRVNDGFVLASDSAASVGASVAGGAVLALNVYNNGNKIFNLRKGLPLAAMTWGLGNIGQASISTLAKDLRARFADPLDEWHLGPDYSMDQVTSRFKEFFWHTKFEPMVAAIPEPPTAEEGDRMALGLLVAGYSAKAETPEIYQLQMSPNGCGELVPVLAEDVGVSAWGQPEAISRILNGMSSAMPRALANLGVPEEDVMPYTLALQQQLQTQLVVPPMPIQDAIDLAEFLVQTTIGFVRFSPGSPTVGGPIEIAAITRHEGFVWVKRKHFFDRALNLGMR